MKGGTHSLTPHVINGLTGTARGVVKGEGEGASQSTVLSISPPPHTSETPALYNCPLTAAGTVTSERTVRFHTLCSIVSSTSGRTADRFLLLLSLQ